MGDKTIDIIIPAYNAHNTIGKTLSSIATQNIADKIKVTIVNDCSDKDYSEFVNSFSILLDIEEIKLEKNVGCGLARQTGVDVTNSKYIMFIDADDMYMFPFAVQMLYNAMEHVYENDTLLDVTYSCIDAVNSVTGQTKYTIQANHGTWLHGAIYRRSFIESKDIRFNDSSRGEDVSFNKLCKLCSNQYRLGTMDDSVLYLWTDANENRINNEVFKLVYARIGYIENLLYVYKFLDEHRDACTYSFEEMRIDAVANFMQMYIQYSRFYEELPKLIEVMDVVDIKDNIDTYVDLIKELYEYNYRRYVDIITDEDIRCVYDENIKREKGSIPTFEGFCEFLNILYHDKSDKLKQILNLYLENII